MKQNLRLFMFMSLIRILEEPQQLNQNESAVSREQSTSVVENLAFGSKRSERFVKRQPPFVVTPPPSKEWPVPFSEDSTAKTGAFIEQAGPLGEAFEERSLSAAESREAQLVSAAALDQLGKKNTESSSIYDRMRGQFTKRAIQQRPEPVSLTLEEHEELRKQCLRVLPAASKLCSDSARKAEEVRMKCAAYMRDCTPYIPSADPLQTIGQAFNSGVDIIPFAFEMNGIPYYPINQEGSVGYIDKYAIPFGSWGAGYSDHRGVRDYWSQNTEVKANWVDGKYGYKGSWAVPLVQSLGIEGQGGPRISVPLDQRNLGKIGYDTGYGVGAYYGHNDHVGVNWKEGHMNHQFGVAVPFSRVGENTGVAVAWPGVDKWTSWLSG